MCVNSFSPLAQAFSHCTDVETEYREVECLSCRVRRSSAGMWTEEVWCQSPHTPKSDDKSSFPDLDVPGAFWAFLTLARIHTQSPYYLLEAAASRPYNTENTLSTHPLSKCTSLEPKNTGGQQKKLSAVGLKLHHCAHLPLAPWGKYLSIGGKLSLVLHFPGRSFSHSVRCRLKLKMYSKADRI